MENIGLTDAQVINNRKKYGSNEISVRKKNSFGKLLLESLGDPIIKILLIALGIKIVFLFQDFDWFETIGIFIAVFIASLVSTISEYGSEAAFARLQSESAQTESKVKRNGKLQTVLLDEIVVGDIVYLSSGDKVPADGILVQGNLSVDESSLNGETKEAKKTSTLKNGVTVDEENKVYRGSVVYSGEARMKVQMVGDHTIYGELAKEIQEKQPDSPLKIRLRELAKIISKLGYFGAALVTISYLFNVIVINNNFELASIMNTLTNWPFMFQHILYALTLSVTIIVVAVPEGLPMMITLVLSSNMKRMLKNNVLVRKLVGIETAGSINVLLTDKTGTLTKGKLEVTEMHTAKSKSIKKLKELKHYEKYYQHICYSLYYNNSAKFGQDDQIIGGNSTDRALLAYVSDIPKNHVKVVSNIPFDSTNKYSATTILDDHKITYYKGAAEVLLPKCTKYLDVDGTSHVLLDKKLIEYNIAKETKKGVRVILLAMKENATVEHMDGLIFLGTISIKDELRKEAKEGISLVKSAGIQTIMITGDAKDTAYSIAKEVGLIEEDSIVLTSSELANFNDEEVKKIAPHIAVIARALPTDKSRLVKILEEENLVVGMTGDGVNDAPALKKADVGFAMGSGTEVSKEAADIVILDDNILSISKAILYGRTIFKSIRKFIVFQLTVNMGALVMSIVGPMIGVSTPITIIQMLWINMIMDTLAGVAFSFEPPLKDYMYEKPKKKNEAIINKYMYSQILFTGIYSAVLCILFLKLPIFKQFIRIDDQMKYFMTTYFALFIFIDVFNAFNARTERLNIFAYISQNKIFLIIILFIVVVQINLVYFGGDLFRTYGLTAQELLIAIILAFTVIPVDFIRKVFLRKKHLPKGF